MKLTPASLDYALKKYKINKNKEMIKKINRKIYTEDKINFLKRNYENTELSIEELRNRFNKKFNLNVSFSSINHRLRKNNIRKNWLILKKQRKKWLSGRKSKYTKEVIKFMKKCAKEGLTPRQAREKCEVEFRMPLSYTSFHKESKLHKIKYSYSVPVKEPELFKLEKFKKFIRKIDKIDIYELRDIIIEKFGKNIKIILIRQYCRRNKIKIQENEKLRKRD